MQSNNANEKTVLHATNLRRFIDHIYELDVQQSMKISHQLKKILKNYRHAISRINWGSYEAFFRLIRDKIISKIFNIPNLKIKVYLETNLEDCFFKLLAMVDCIRKEELQRNNTNHEEPKCEERSLIESTDKSLFLKPRI